ncbi:RING finger protein 145 isoform X2 [Calypte anna]|uniref:RING finger protein 145 isoform X2 n=1 Tax=Calypte anna TaxID=9244 RepID=UPI0011C49835|nr:RING finger protein 145 isoform X2 [Calypte anna]
MARLEAVANVALRVPGLALLDLLYRWDTAAIGHLLPHRPPAAAPLLPETALRGLYGLGHLLSLVVLVLPVPALVQLYLHLLTALLLAAGHTAARDYILQELRSSSQGTVYGDTAALGRATTLLAGQLCLWALCVLLLRSRRPWLLGTPLVPVLARLGGVPPHALPPLHAVAAGLAGLQGVLVLGSHLLLPLRMAATATRELAQSLELSRLVALGMSLWGQLSIPLLFLVFWLILFSLRLISLLAPSDSPPAPQGLLFLLLSRGVTEGVTLLLLALQTGLLDLQVLQRTFLLSIILFIVVTSTLQSMIEITDPILLALGASRNRSPWKHFRGVSMCLFLLLFPCFMAYKIAHLFHLDFWLLILVSSCMLTSLQVMGTLFIYTLFMVELVQEAPLERMDEIIYWVKAVSRVLEFLVALSVVGYGSWESLFGEWSWLGASVIIIHSYFNVWLRAQAGWRSFLLRRHAAQSLSALPRATASHLRDHDDICAICFQDMEVALVTPCAHIFHASCLRKWLYVQDTCPMCHRRVTPVAARTDPAGARGDSGGDEGQKDGAATSGPEGTELTSGHSVGSERRDLDPPDPARPQEVAGGAGAVLQPPGDPHPQDTQPPCPPPSCPDPPASPELHAGDNGDCHSSHHPS